MMKTMMKMLLAAAFTEGGMGVAESTYSLYNDCESDLLDIEEGVSCQIFLPLTKQTYCQSTKGGEVACGSDFHIAHYCYRRRPRDATEAEKQEYVTGCIGFVNEAFNLGLEDFLL